MKTAQVNRPEIFSCLFSGLLLRDPKSAMSEEVRLYVYIDGSFYTEIGKQARWKTTVKGKAEIRSWRNFRRNRFVQVAKGTESESY